MTTITMNAMNLAYSRKQTLDLTQSWLRAAPKLHAIVESTAETADAAFDRAIEFTGGLALAAIPFSLLAWMFVAL